MTNIEIKEQVDKSNVEWEFNKFVEWIKDINGNIEDRELTLIDEDDYQLEYSLLDIGIMQDDLIFYIKEWLHNNRPNEFCVFNYLNVTLITKCKFMKHDSVYSQYCNVID